MARKCKLSIFISHSSEDANIVKAFVELLEGLGLQNNRTIVCSSVAGYKVPGGANIYTYLRDKINSDNVVFFYFLSANYYKSPACLNEMGAAWVKGADGLAFVLPNFKYNQVRGAIDPRNIMYSLENDAELDDRLDELCDFLKNTFTINNVNISAWQRHKDDFKQKCIDFDAETKAKIEEKNARKEKAVHEIINAISGKMVDSVASAMEKELLKSKIANQ